MAFWIGPLGALKQVLWPVSLKETAPTRWAIQTAASRRWAFMAHTGGRRSWAAEVKGTQEDTAYLSVLAQSSRTAPLIFVSDEAAATNVLTPTQSLLEGVANGGPFSVHDGPSSLSSVTGGGRAVVADTVPVVPGLPVTVSIYVQGSGASLSMQFYDSQGAAVGTQATKTSQSDAVQRLAVSISTVPLKAAFITVRVSGASQAALPAVSWTAGPVPWDVGMGCTSAVIGEVTTTYEGLHHADGSLWRSTSVTIEEVG